MHLLYKRVKHWGCIKYCRKHQKLRYYWTQDLKCESQPNNTDNYRQHKNNFLASYNANTFTVFCTVEIQCHKVTKFAIARNVAMVSITKWQRTLERTLHVWITVESTARKWLKLLTQCKAGQETRNLVIVCLQVDGVCRLSHWMQWVLSHFCWLPYEQA